MADEFTDAATGERRPLVNIYGRWADPNQLTAPAVLRRNRYKYFESYESLFRSTNVRPTAFSNEDMDAKFAEFPHLQYDSTFRADDWGPYVERMFRIEENYFWRRAEPGERLYHRFDDGSVCIPVSHLKGGFRVAPHKFVMDLFRMYFYCPLAQFTPNSIRAINWFIASCEARGKQPTVKAFFCLFDVKASRAKPFYELQFIKPKSRIGQALGGYRPFSFPKGMAGWHEEFLVLGGGEFPWQRNFVERVECDYKIDRSRLSQNEIDILVRTVRALGEVWTEKHLVDPADLRRHCCEFFVLLNHVYVLYLIWVLLIICCFCSVGPA